MLDLQYLAEYLTALRAAQPLLKTNYGLTNVQIARAAYANLAIDRPNLPPYREMEQQILDSLAPAEFPTIDQNEL